MRPKLAELCGIKEDPGNPLDRPLSSGLWRPDEDVAQAIRCLESLGPEWSWTIRRREVSITNVFNLDPWTPTHLGFSDSIPRNICLAISAALGWTSSDAVTHPASGDLEKE